LNIYFKIVNAQSRALMQCYSFIFPAINQAVDIEAKLRAVAVAGCA
jgi:hypothetical protein